MNHVPWTAITISHGLILRYLELGGAEREDTPEMQPVFGRLKKFAPVNRFLRALADEIGKRIDECNLAEIRAAWDAHDGALPPTEQDMAELFATMEECGTVVDDEQVEGFPEDARIMRLVLH